MKSKQKRNMYKVQLFSKLLEVDEEEVLTNYLRSNFFLTYIHVCTFY